jgi:citrate synthase
MAKNTRGGLPIRSNIARATADSVHVHGLNMTTELLGKVNLGDFAFLELFKRLPDPRESVLVNALLVSLAEHGVTPSVIASRMTIMGAPESLQGAVAAGLLGLGNTFVGTIEGAAKVCQEELPHAGKDGVEANERLGDDEITALAAKIIDEHKAAGKSIAGIGHPVHKPVDPRAQRLFEIATELGFDDSTQRLMTAISTITSERSGKVLPVNVTGAIGALASTLGLPWNVARGLGVMARSVGLVGHLLEESEQPMAGTIWTETEAEAVRP